MQTKNILLLILFLIIIFFPFTTVFSQTVTDPGGAVHLDNPLQTSDPNLLIGQVINAVLGIVGSLALVMFIFGGLTWMLAAGNQEKVRKGKDILVWAAIGLVVIFSSYALVRFVFSGLGVQ